MTDRTAPYVPVALGIGLHEQPTEQILRGNSQPRVFNNIRASYATAHHVFLSNIRHRHVIDSDIGRILDSGLVISPRAITPQPVLLSTGYRFLLGQVLPTMGLSPAVHQVTPASEEVGSVLLLRLGGLVDHVTDELVDDLATFLVTG